MNQTLSVKQLTDRLLRVEKEVGIIRKELVHLRQHTKPVTQAETARAPAVFTWADKEEQRRWIKHLFAGLSIQGAPMGAEVLQQRMNQAGLVPNELSQSLVEAREE